MAKEVHRGIDIEEQSPGGECVFTFTNGVTYKVKDIWVAVWVINLLIHRSQQKELRARLDPKRDNSLIKQIHLEIENLKALIGANSKRQEPEPEIDFN